MVGEVSEDLISNQEILREIDFAFAKGKLSMQMKGIEPTLNKEKLYKYKKWKTSIIRS